MATDSSILAWRNPWTEEAGRLQSTESQESDTTLQLKREREREQGFPGGASGKGAIPGPGRHPGEGTATLSSILAWGIPRTEQPGRLKSIGLHRVRHD